MLQAKESAPLLTAVNLTNTAERIQTTKISTAKMLILNPFFSRYSQGQPGLLSDGFIFKDYFVRIPETAGILDLLPQCGFTVACLDGDLPVRRNDHAGDPVLFVDDDFSGINALPALRFPSFERDTPVSGFPPPSSPSPPARRWRCGR